MRTIHNLDLCTGIGGFTFAHRDIPEIETICTAEVDSYCSRHIDQNLGLDNAGDVELLLTSRENHPHKEFVEKDLVPVEETGFTSLCMEDFLEGILPFPTMITAGSPCQQVSEANTKYNHLGIQGDDSKLVHKILDYVEDLMPDYFLLENSARLNKRGLIHILMRLSKIGYIIEFETVTAAAVGLSHLRHRIYVVAYLRTTPLATNNIRAFESLRRTAARMTPNKHFPLTNELTSEQIDNFTVDVPKSIPLRTRRIKALGNSIVPEIPRLIYKSIIKAEKMGHGKKKATPRKGEVHEATAYSDGWFKGQATLFDAPMEITETQTRGIVINCELYSGEPDRRLNPSKNDHQHLWSTIHARDGSNNFNPSRLERPGKLGGINQSLMLATGKRSGAAHPLFGELLMGYPPKYTELP
ncbi:DNA cytosine methyltransferase [Vibrio barjaei]|uniref:DNA cytosine methyltransferase n=1 Tax=Vibrio barjaei TaxID=1676683 RepID=UPI002285374A|nr:DNA cytosine methyltransferase [Vibrio barjaei]MCY9870435.1 DNA cytosine methyltransferase [Vibrio barjaei]